MWTPEQYMQLALQLARRGLGQTWPNPTVGCVIVKDGEIIARSNTAKGGRPHAEAQALEQAGTKCEGATVYVTLEPCAHYGKTPPCAEGLIKARVAEVVVGCIDPDQRVAGKGIKVLEDIGIKVTLGVLEKECRDLNAGFFKRIEKGFPLVTLKAAVSEDGKYLAGNGEPRWLTGELARNHSQLLRAQHDVIITGTGTVLADNPQLNCRLPGMEDFSPIKVVIGNTPLPKTAKIFQGKQVWHYEKSNLSKILKALAEKGVTRVLVEAGPILSTAFLQAGLVDELIIFQSPQILGNSALSFFAKDYLNKFTKFAQLDVGDDRMLTYKSRT